MIGSTTNIFLNMLLTYHMLRSAQLFTLNEMGNIEYLAYWVKPCRPVVADWGGGMFACCTTFPVVCWHIGNASWQMVCCGIISSCQSAATFEIVKHFWS